MFACKVKEWLHNLGIVDHATVVHHDDESDDGAFSLHDEQTTRNRWMHASIVFNPIN